MPKFVFYPFEESRTLVAATATEVTLKAPNLPGSIGVRYDFLAYDEGKVGNGTIQDLRVKFEPTYNRDMMGGAQYHTPYAVATPGTSNRHVLPLGGVILKRDEDVKVTLLSAAGGAIVWRVERTVIFPD